jgi:Predicted metal-binding, possibly nucleic acid-binding protein
MLIDVSEVLSNDSKVLDLQAVLDLNTFSSKLGEFSITKKAPVDLIISNIGKKKLSIKGETNLVLDIPCGRCLESVAVEFQFSFDKVVDLTLTELEQVDEMDEFNYIIDNKLNVDKLIYNEVLVNWPITVLCSTNCKGICNRCGANRNMSTCDCDTTVVDPRMAAISDIFSKFKEV